MELMSLWILGFAPQIENFPSVYLVAAYFLVVGKLILYIILCFPVYLCNLNYQVP